jgi:hypothetical protein
MIYAGAQCGSQDVEETATYIADAATLARTIAATRRYILNGDVPLPVVDFAREAAVFISMGTKPSSGYGLSLPADSAHQVGDRLEIRLDWRAPARDAAVAQALTSPCVILKVPREGYARIRILDQAGRMRTQIDRP